MIIGVGVDLCDKNRIAKIFQNYSDKFLNKILSVAELEQFQTLSEGDKADFLAKRWAIKEAFAKASALGLSGIGMRNVTIINTPITQHFGDLDRHLKILDSSKPSVLLEVFLKEKLKSHFKTSSEIKIHISVSYENEYVIGFVVLEI